MTAFVRNVLGLPLSHLDGEWAIFPLESGKRDYFEIYGPGHTDERLMRAASDEPRAALETASAKIIRAASWRTMPSPTPRSRDSAGSSSVLQTGTSTSSSR